MAKPLIQPWLLVLLVSLTALLGCTSHDDRVSQEKDPVPTSGKWYYFGDNVAGKDTLLEAWLPGEWSFTAYLYTEDMKHFYIDPLNSDRVAMALEGSACVLDLSMFRNSEHFIDVDQWAIDSAEWNSVESTIERVNTSHLLEKEAKFLRYYPGHELMVLHRDSTEMAPWISSLLSYRISHGGDIYAVTTLAQKDQWTHFSKVVCFSHDVVMFSNALEDRNSRSGHDALPRLVRLYERTTDPTITGVRLP